MNEDFDPLPRSVLSRFVMTLVIGVLTALLLALTVEGGTQLLSLKSDLAPIAGLVLMGLVAPSLIVGGVFAFKKLVL